MNSALLAHDETLVLIAEAQNGDGSATDKLVKCNSALVKSIVKRFLGRGVEYDDLFQIGCMGLIKAIQNYDASFNVRFSTYAVPMILGEIKRFLRDDGSIKVSRSLKETAIKALNIQEQMKDKLGRTPTINEISEAIGIPSEDIVFAFDAAKTPLSIYENAYDDSSVLLVDRMMTDESQQEELIDKILLKELIGKLDMQERRIIVLRYFQDKTQSEIASVLGISQVQVSRMESKILAKLRKYAK